MSVHSNFELEQHLRCGMEALTTDLADQLWEMPVQQPEAVETQTDFSERKPLQVRRAMTRIAAVAACLMVVCVSWLRLYMHAGATVYLDVNPSVSVQINRSEKVVGVTANNADGAVVLEQMDLRHTDLDVAINALLGSMVKHGYLSEAQNEVLLSVEGSDERWTQTLRQELSAEVDETLTTLVGGGSVLDQAVKTDTALKNLAAEYGITPGKAALIRQLVEANPSLTCEELAGLSMRELAATCRREGIDLRDYANLTGTEFPEAETPPPSAEPSPAALPSPSPSPPPEPTPTPVNSPAIAEPTAEPPLPEMTQEPVATQIPTDWDDDDDDPEDDDPEDGDPEDDDPEVDDWDDDQDEPELEDQDLDDDDDGDIDIEWDDDDDD